MQLTKSLTKLFSVVVLISLIVLSLTSCLKSYVNAPYDTAQVSKILSKEKTKGITETVPFSGREVYKAVEEVLTQPRHAVVRYKYNNLTRHYHTHSFLYDVAPPNRANGAIISSKTGFLRAIFSLTLVYVEPKGDRTFIRVVNQNGDLAPDAVLQEIIQKLENK